MTLNQRVPGSSPGAPTKPFKDLPRFRIRTDLPVGSLCSVSALVDIAVCSTMGGMAARCRSGYSVPGGVERQTLLNTEDELGFKLFDRSKGRPALTPEPEWLFPACAPLSKSTSPSSRSPLCSRGSASCSSTLGSRRLARRVQPAARSARCAAAKSAMLLKRTS